MCFQIIALSPQMPYPPLDGGREGIWGFCEALAEEGVELTVLCNSKFNKKTIINNITVIECKINKILRIYNIIVSLFCARHFKFDKYFDSKIKSTIQKMISENPDAVVLCFHPHMAVNLKNFDNDFDFYIRSHNIESDLVISYITHLKLPLLKALGHIARRHELKLWNRSKRVFFLNDRDAKRAMDLGLSLDKVRIANEGVHPRASKSQSELIHKYSVKRIGYLFNRNAPQNVENLKFFLKNFWLPSDLYNCGITLQITGNCSDILNKILGTNYSNFGIEAIGYVPDIIQFYDEISILVSPTFVGSGVRKKILESFSYSTPVIMTNLDRECLSYLPNNVLLSFDDVLEMNEKIFEIFESSDIYCEKALNVHQTVNTTASWKMCVDSFMANV